MSGALATALGGALCMAWIALVHFAYTRWVNPKASVSRTTGIALLLPILLAVIAGTISYLWRLANGLT